MGNFTYLVEGIEEVERHSQLFKYIRGIVNEELGIHYGVAKASSKIIDKIKEKLNEYPKNYYSYVDGASYRTGNFPFKAFGKTINIHFRYCNFRDKYYYNMGVDNLPTWPNGFKLSTLTLSIDIHAISGNIIETTLTDTVQHEIEHYFQETKIGKSFSEDDPYYKASRFVKDYYGSNDEVARRVGNIMYFSQKCENEAYVNGLYALLVKNYKEDGKPTSSVIETSPVYQGLLQLRRDKEWLIKNKNNPQVNELIKVIRNEPPKGMGVNVSVNGLIKYAEYSDNEIIRRIGKAIVKAQKDCNQLNDLEPTWWK